MFDWKLIRSLILFAALAGLVWFVRYLYYDYQCTQAALHHPVGQSLTWDEQHACEVAGK